MAKTPEFILWDTYPLDEDAIPWITLAETDIYPGRVLDPGIQFGTNDRKARWYGRSLFLPPSAQVKALAELYPGGDPQRPDWSRIRADLEAGGLFDPHQPAPRIEEIIDRLGRLKPINRAAKGEDSEPFYKPSHFKKWNIGDELLRKNSTNGGEYLEGQVRRKKKTPSSGKCKRPVYWYSEPDARLRWPDRFNKQETRPPRA